MSKYKIFSTGYRCSSAGIIKHMNLKTESFPFDWLISRLSVIQHCIDDNFNEFLKLDNYSDLNTKTYDSYNDKIVLICDEKVIYNRFYTPKEIYEKKDINTYNYYLSLNHKNLFISEDYSYYKRCIKRFYDFLLTNENKLFLHISKMINKIEYEEKKEHIIKEMVEFNNYMTTKTSNITGLFFIIVKDDIDICNLNKIIDTPHIYTLFTTKKFMDAGEIFMGDCHAEINCIINEINKLLNN